MKKTHFVFALLLGCLIQTQAQSNRLIENFNKNWKFYYADTTDKKMDYEEATYNDAKWRTLNLPHDWSIELTFDKNNPATPEGGALPGGIGWYRKTFTVPAASKGKQVSIEFDGVYRCSRVWINGHLLGYRPNGYISFQYDLTPYLKYGTEQNNIAVQVDNSQQENSRWYSGSGIYRNVRLVTTNNIAVDHWGMFVTTPKVTDQEATIKVKTKLRNALDKPATISLNTILVSAFEIVKKFHFHFSYVTIINIGNCLNDNFNVINTQQVTIMFYMK